MPKDKDLKRLARERMEKTGESYTTARAQLLAKRSLAGERLSETALAELAGMSTEALVRATHHDWSWWLDYLKGVPFKTKEHREITRYVEENFDISAWWVQSVVIGYERIVGLREIGQSRTGSYEANKSKTLPVPIETLFNSFGDATTRGQWLPDVDWKVRKATPNRSIRLEWADGCPVELWFTAKGDAKSSVQIQHRKLASKEDIARIKEEWTARFEDLKRFLAAQS
ncbi:MAG: hypothetical protein K0U98_01325 [Deltaproteobacteria bacterium]|nr:hypothetical protein [Deltaproteobacteria bacterium]